MTDHPTPPPARRDQPTPAAGTRTPLLRTPLPLFAACGCGSGCGCGCQSGAPCQCSGCSH
ncbi:hypothetical protein [Actinacidiphila sp. ITFR-21]|uniref:hypothetical protein n=1 Tax=Actinacidiphila sp. ITFR-21 TaxID=3075199 RepID=UPI00288A8980|nr:hypothetical protein [Streptomyces sp. ITFR-21]WNI17045.1 hypothetical protein RLT57_16980 [Streptomyces sp. ITFR-21]